MNARIQAPPPEFTATNPRLAKTSRFLSLPWLILIAIMGFLPWSAVSCNAKDFHVQLSQSGYQALYGGVSSPFDSIEAAQEAAQQQKKSVHELAKQVAFERTDFLISCSPFLVFFWVAVLAMVLLVCLLPLSVARLEYSLALVAVMMVTLLIQLVMDTPLERRITKIVSEMIREDPTQAMTMMAVISSGKTVWFWLVALMVILLGVSEAFANTFLGKSFELVPHGLPVTVVVVAACLGAMGVIVQVAFREFGISVLQSKIDHLNQIEQAKLAKVEQAKRDRERSEIERQQEREREHQDLLQRQKNEKERIDQQLRQAERENELKRLELQRINLEKEKTLELERLRRYEEEKELERQQLERKAKEAEQNKIAAEKQRLIDIEKEKERKVDLESRGLPYYPKPTTIIKGNNATYWYEKAKNKSLDLNTVKESASKLSEFKEEGVPFLLDLLSRDVTNPYGKDAVLSALAPEYIHANDLARLISVAANQRCLSSTRITVLRYLSKRKESGKFLEEIKKSVTDLSSTKAKHWEEVIDLLVTIEQSSK
jgi:hypothetical protein